MNTTGGSRMTTIIAIALATALLLWKLSGYLPTRNIAVPAYIVVAAKQDYEINRYEPFIVAETRRGGDPTEALSAGFNELFRYITGNIAWSSKIKMTAPERGPGRDRGRRHGRVKSVRRRRLPAAPRPGHAGAPRRRVSVGRGAGPAGGYRGRPPRCADPRSAAWRWRA